MPVGAGTRVALGVEPVCTLRALSRRDFVASGLGARGNYRCRDDTDGDQDVTPFPGLRCGNRHQDPFSLSLSYKVGYTGNRFPML
ncbi:MAG: hypothetical protein CMJ70_03040 [Planctomycetaceae bacterium]|nr:hypothetical protein [Planctomycetaceae bacterium]